MTEQAESTRTLVIERDFEPTVGRKFRFQSGQVPGWDGLIDCQVQVVEPLKRLSYTWSALGLDSVVFWTLTPTGAGTHLRLEHSGFGPGQDQAYKGANYGWQRFLGALERLLGEEMQ